MCSSNSPEGACSPYCWPLFRKSCAYHPDHYSLGFCYLYLLWNMLWNHLWYHIENIYPVIPVSGIRLWLHCDARPVQLITIYLSVCPPPPPPPAGSPPPGKADRLPPQVTGLLDGNQKLPRPSQAAHLLHPGAVWAIQPHHGRRLQVAHRGEMSSEGTAVHLSLITGPTQGRNPWTSLNPCLPYKSRGHSLLAVIPLLLFCCYRFYHDEY